MKNRNKINYGFASMGFLLATLAVIGVIGGGVMYGYNKTDDSFASLNMMNGIDDKYNHDRREGIDMYGLVDDLPIEELSDIEMSTILTMREEEKMAQDLYTAFYQKWGIDIFRKVLKSENQHFDVIGRLLERYNLQDPTEGLSIGEFNNSDIADLYNRLLNTGLSSREDAVQVAMLIEDLDINDLNNAINDSDNNDLRKVYSNLKRASENHMRIFAGEMEDMGMSYNPQHISNDEYKSILNSDMNKGGHNRHENGYTKGRIEDYNKKYIERRYEKMHDGVMDDGNY